MLEGYNLKEVSDHDAQWNQQAIPNMAIAQWLVD